MAVDYRRQYTPKQLEPLWPDGIIRLVVASLCTLAVTIALAVLPVILDYAEMGDWIEEREPADTGATPAHIHPEWYFLAIYQALKLSPGDFFGISGTTLAVVSQLVFILAVVLLPFWACRVRTYIHGVCVTLAIGVFVVFTLWAVWPPPPVLAITVCSTVVLFCVLVVDERRRIRRAFREPQNAGK